MGVHVFRKFYFENFFIEILWVINEEEIQSNLTAKTKLWERSQFEKNQYSRFGLCLVNSKSTDELFENSDIYQPSYFPEGMSIDIITNEEHPQLPWTFRLPYRDKKKIPNEPTEHSNGIKLLTHMEFEVQKKSDTKFENYLRDVGNIQFKSSNRTHVTLEFDHQIQEKSQEFSKLNLTIKY